MTHFAPRVRRDERPAAGADLALEDLAARLGDLAGLAFPAGRRSLLRQAIATLVAEHPAAAHRLAHEVAAPGAVRDRLIGLATVGETYLFRDPEQLQLLQRRLLAPLVGERSTTARPAIRIWSAGCATGEEAYTLAILVRELVTEPARWTVRVIGSDIDRAAVAAARRGTYGAWSFRVPLGARERWFEPLPDGRRRVRDELRPWVRFVEHNLASSAPSPPPELEGPADLVVLRNVLLYLDGAARARALEAARLALRPGGWLLVAPVEAPAVAPEGFERLAIDGRAIFRRGQALGTPRREPVAAPRIQPAGGGPSSGERRPWTLRRRSAASLHAGPTPSAVAAPPSPGPAPRPRTSGVASGAPDPLGRAWELADRGAFEAAAEEAAEVARASRLPAAASMCLALIAVSSGDAMEARGHLRQVLAAAPDHPVANLHLALLDLAAGRRREGLARLRSTLRLVAAQDGEARLADVPRGTVGDLRRVARALLEAG